MDLAGVSRGALWRLAHHKRWMYVAIASDELLIGVAVAHLGYLANTFAFAFERGSARLGVDRSALGPALVGEVNDRAGAGHGSRFRLGSTAVAVTRPRGATAYDVEVTVRDLQVTARLETEGAPPAISVVAPIPGGVLNTTEKRALLSVTGEATVGGHRFSLDGALGGYDYTQGLLARRTAWRWAFALGRARSGERVGLNLVEGFVGEPECALWVDGELFPLAEGRFEFDRAKPSSPWRVRTADGGVDLRFTPGGVHAEHKNFGIVASRFVQPMGVYEGTIRCPDGRVLELSDVLGVTEDQDMLW